MDDESMTMGHLAVEPVEATAHRSLRELSERSWEDEAVEDADRRDNARNGPRLPLLRTPRENVPHLTFERHPVTIRTRIMEIARPKSSEPPFALHGAVVQRGTDTADHQGARSDDVSQDVTMNPLAAAIHAAVAPPAKDLLHFYYEPHGPFAGATFDMLPNNDSSGFTPEDIVAASLLDVRFNPLAVRALLDPKGKPASALRDIRDDIALWDPDAELALAPAYVVWEVLMDLDGVGGTRASKLLARKRPQLIPIVDSVIKEALPLGSNSWTTLRGALQSPATREAIDAVRPTNAPPGTMLLRLLDVAVWMRHSRSRNARRVRAEVLGSPSP